MALTALIAIIPATRAFAQADTFYDRGNNVSILQRPRPEYAAFGLREGAFVISPSVAVIPEYDDNIFATNQNKQGAFILGVEPGVRVRSDWSRHELDGFANLTSNIYSGHGSEDTTDYQFGGSGRLDVSQAIKATASLSYAHSTQPRTSENNISTAQTPLQYDQLIGSIGSTQRINRLDFSEKFNLVRVAYDNAIDSSGHALLSGSQEQTDYILTGRANYGFMSDISVFGQVVLNSRPLGAVGSIDRSSSGYEATVGASFDLTRLMRGQVQVGYFNQDYSSSVFHSNSGPAFHATVNYFFTELTTITLGADRTVIDAADPTTPTYLSSLGRVRVDHELLRNVILSGWASYEVDQFSGLDRKDQRFSASAGFNYFLNRHWTLNGNYTLLTENSAGLNRIQGFTVDVISLSLIFQL